LTALHLVVLRGPGFSQFTMNFDKFDDFQLRNPSYINEILTNISFPIGWRMRALFHAKSLGHSDAVNLLQAALSKHAKDEVLFRHEACYVLGQIGPTIENHTAVMETLETILADPEEDPVTRHEAAEGLGNFGAERSLAILKRFSGTDIRVLKETVDLAIAEQQRKLIESDDTENTPEQNRFLSYDPSKSYPGKSIKDIPELEKTLLDKSADMVQRYRSMMTLRDLSMEPGSKGAENALISCFIDPVNDSPLFLHEVAFVVGQMASPHCSECLIQVTNNDKLHGMIRHEAAISLGYIATRIQTELREDGDQILKNVLECLKKNSEDPLTIVKDSCLTALFNYEMDHETSVC